MILRLSTTPGTITCSRPAYRSSVFSRTIIRSTFVQREATPGRFLTGRRFAYRSSALRSPTLTLVNPSPIGVVHGPLSATLFRVIESSSSAGSVWPVFSNAVTPASCRSQSIATPVASSTDVTAAVTSGPMPSPGINVSVCVVRGMVHPLAARGESPALHRDRRSARLTRRDDREYPVYLREEQRRQAGCSAGRMQRDFHHGLLVYN